MDSTLLHLGYIKITISMLYDATRGSQWSDSEHSGSGIETTMFLLWLIRWNFRVTMRVPWGTAEGKK